MAGSDWLSWPGGLRSGANQVSRAGTAVVVAAALVPGVGQQLAGLLGDRAAGFGNPFAVDGDGSFYRHHRGSGVAGANRPAASSPLSFGVNVAGFFRSEKGIGEGSRAIVRALDAAGIPYVLVNGQVAVDDGRCTGVLAGQAVP